MWPRLIFLERCWWRLILHLCINPSGNLLVVVYYCCLLWWSQTHVGPPLNAPQRSRWSAAHFAPLWFKFVASFCKHSLTSSSRGLNIQQVWCDRRQVRNISLLMWNDVGNNVKKHIKRIISPPLLYIQHFFFQILSAGFEGAKICEKYDYLTHSTESATSC